MVRYDAHAMTFVLDVRDMPDDESVRQYAEALGLSRKDEFHVTILGRATGETILAHISQWPEEKRQEASTQINQLVHGTNWEIRFTDDFYFLEKTYSDPPETRRSIIRMVGVSSVGEFYEALDRLLGLRLDRPVMHVTLFTDSTRAEKRLR
jgi:hypothetical protein